MEYHDRLEYYAALSPWATFNVHRKPEAQFLQADHFMLRRRGRLEAERPGATEHQEQGSPARLVAPVPPEGRWALPGERPPSKYKPGERDAVIERYDLYARAYWAGAVNRHGR